MSKQWTVLLALSILAGCSQAGSNETAAATAGPLQVPQYAVDPTWLKPKPDWALGQIADVHVDSQDHVWILHRPRTTKPEPGQVPAPSVWEVAPDGNVIQAWGGPGDNGYEWPDNEHGIFATHDGHVWISGHQPGRDHHVLKFTRDGKFVMQIGKRGQSKGNADTQNVNRVASVWVHPKTNELFLGDGYGNRRVIVYDQTTGAFKRMWGAFGNVPEERQPGEPVFSSDETGDGPPQFNNPHSVKVSNDDLVYVADRDNQRVQVFTLEGKYVKQVFISRGTMPPSTYTGLAFGKPRNQIADDLLKDPASATRLAFSPDPEQRLLYVGDRRTHFIHILDRETLQIVGKLADGPGDQPGQLYIIHGVATDSKGNVYTAETMPNVESQGGLIGRPGASGTDDPHRGNRRAQKFVLTGYAPAMTGTH